MISDEELKAISQVDPNEVVGNYCKVFSVPQGEAEIAMGPVMRAREIAKELLQLREEKRKTAEGWEGASTDATHRSADKLQTLRDHQAWRMGADIPMDAPKDITAAIDYAIQCCEAIQRIDDEMTRKENDKRVFHLLIPEEIRALIQGPIKWVEE